MATFKQLQDRVKARIIDLPAATVAEVPLFVNKAIRDAQERHNFRIMEASQEFVTTPNDHALGTILDLKEIREKPWLRIGDGGTLEIEWGASHSDIVRMYATTDTTDAGRPETIFQASIDDDGVASFEVYPYPDTNSLHLDGNYRVNIPYWRYLPNLVVETDTNWFTNFGDEFVFLQATARAFESNFDEARADRYFARATIEFQKLVKIDKRSRLPRSLVLVPRRDVHAIHHQDRM